MDLSPEQLLIELLQGGIRLWLVDENIRYRVARGRMTDRHLNAFRELKDKLTSLLLCELSGKGWRNPPANVAHGFDIASLSFAQERLWLLEQTRLAGSTYNMSMPLRLQGRLDVGALQRSLGELVRRHESLRTRFDAMLGQAIQVIEPPSELNLDGLDLSGLGELDREAQVRLRVKAEFEQPFNLAGGPLFRICLLRLSDEEHVLLMSMHHIVSDGWSMEVVRRELTQLYGAYSRGRASPLPELAMQYADFALWQRGWLQGEELDRQLSYWRDRLSGAPAALELPTDRPRPATASLRGATAPMVLPMDLSQALARLAQEEGATLYMVLLAAFQMMLWRWSGQKDIVVGSPIAGRTHRQFEDLIGCFANALPMRTHLSGELTFRELLSRVRESALQAYAHQDVPFEKLVAELQPERDLSRHALFHVFFSLQDAPAEAFDLSGLTATSVDLELATTKLDLSLSLSETPLGLRGIIEYATDLFDAETIKRLAGRFRRVAEQVVAEPNLRLNQFQLLGEDERRQLLVDWNATAQQFSGEGCVHELFETEARRTPDAVAVVCEERKLTYRELDRRSNQLAHRLRGLGVGPDVFVGLLLERSLEMIVGLLGIWKAGGAYLPLDPEYPQGRLSFMWEDARALALVTRSELMAKAPKHAANIVLIDETVEGLAADPDHPLSFGARPDNLAYLIYTSGSTGTPKGVAIRHEGLSNLAHVERVVFEVDSASRVLQFASLSFDVSIAEAVVALTNGASLHIARHASVVLGSQLVQMLQEREISFAFLPPAVLPTLAGHEFPHLRTLVVGGDVCPISDAEPWVDRCRFVNVYGPTEITSWATFAVLNTGMDRAPIGRPISNTQVYVLDSELEPVAVGAPGELYIAGVGLARGYLNRPGFTAERFLANPFGEAGSRMHRTGDRVRWRADGQLEFLGRMDQQVKIRGFRVELGEIEARLSEHATVRSAVVLAREDERIGKRLVAYVVAAPGESIEVEALRSHLKTYLPDYMMPSAFVILEALPLAANGGKVDRNALPAPELRPQELGFVAPRTATEAAMSQIWAQVLKVDRVGIHDNFFELGGDSLLASSLVHRMRVQGMRMDMRMLFTAPVLQDLATSIDAQSGGFKAPLNHSGSPK